VVNDGKEERRGSNKNKISIQAIQAKKQKEEEKEEVIHVIIHKFSLLLNEKQLNK